MALSPVAVRDRPSSPSGQVAPTILESTPDSERVRRCLEADRVDPCPQAIQEQLAIQPDMCPGGSIR